MKYLVLAVALLAPSTALASLSAPAYPGCDLEKQQSLEAETGGDVQDPRQAHVLARSDILKADIGTARKAGHLSQQKAQSLWQRVDDIVGETNGFVEEQGFLSAAERASYDRELDAIAGELCG